VDHAGLSQPPAPWKDTTSSKMENCFPLPNNNSLIASHHALDAMVDGNLMPWNTYKRTVKFSRAITPTKLPTEHARPDNGPPRLTLLQFTPFQSTPLLTSEPPLLKDQPPSPLRPTSQSSRDTPLVSSTHPLAEPDLTTPSPVLVTEAQVAKTTSSSETHGVQAGEIKVTSRLPPKKNPTGGNQQWVSAESNKLPSGQPWSELILRSL